MSKAKKEKKEKVKKADEKKIMSAAQYAKHRRVSKEAVKKAIQQGRIYAKPTGKNGYEIDPEAADKQWEENTKPLIDESTPIEKYAEGEDQKFNETDLDDPTKKISFSQARSIKEKYGARLAKLKFEEESKKLVRADEVKADAFKTARIVRNLLLNIPDRVSAELASITDPFEVNMRLKKEINDCLKSLSSYEFDQSETDNIKNEEDSIDED